MDYYIKLMDYEESTKDFVEIHRFGGKLISMSRLISELCKNLDGTAFYASSKNSEALFTRSDYGFNLRKSAQDLFNMMNSNDIPEFLLNKSKKELEFLTVYSRIGDSLEKSIR